MPILFRESIRVNLGRKGRNPHFFLSLGQTCSSLILLSWQRAPQAHLQRRAATLVQPWPGHLWLSPVVLATRDIASLWLCVWGLVMSNLQEGTGHWDWALWRPRDCSAKPKSLLLSEEMASTLSRPVCTSDCRLWPKWPFRDIEPPATNRQLTSNLFNWSNCFCTFTSCLRR